MCSQLQVGIILVQFWPSMDDYLIFRFVKYDIVVLEANLVSFRDRDRFDPTDLVAPGPTRMGMPVIAMTFGILLLKCLNRTFQFSESVLAIQTTSPVMRKFNHCRA